MGETPCHSTRTGVVGVRDGFDQAEEWRTAFSPHFESILVGLNSSAHPAGEQRFDLRVNRARGCLRLLRLIFGHFGTAFPEHCSSSPVMVSSAGGLIGLFEGHRFFVFARSL